MQTASHLLTTLKTSTTFRHLHQTHAVLITAGLSHLLRLTGGAALHVHLRRHGLKPSKHTYPLLLKSLRSNRDNPSQIHAELLKFGFHSDPFAENALVSAYINTDLVSARNVFDGMCNTDVVSYTAMINGYVRNCRENEAMTLFSAMRVDGVPVDGMVVATVLNSCGIVGNVWMGRCVHGFYVECGRVEWDVYVGTALVDMYGKCGYADDARRVFDEMPVRNVVAWGALIAGYVRCSSYQDAISVFRDMIGGECEPNEVTLGSVITACARLGVLDQGRWIHSYMNRKQIKMNAVIGTALIDMYAKCGCLDDALGVFRGLSQKGVHSWTTLINGLAMHGRAVECLAIFTQMTRDGVLPNDVTFVGVLSACSHGGLVDQGQKYFCSMVEDYGIVPKLAHYSCMVDLFGRAGQMKEALQVIESMPMEPTTGIWGALLGACMIHKDFGLGERIGKHLAAMQPHHSGQCAILANMYSLSEKPGEAASIRSQMKESRIHKIPGCSWLEVNGALHEFVAFNAKHPQSKLIYETVYGITRLMKQEHLLSSRPFAGMDVS